MWYCVSLDTQILAKFTSQLKKISTHKIDVNNVAITGNSSLKSSENSDRHNIASNLVLVCKLSLWEVII